MRDQDKLSNSKKVLSSLPSAIDQPISRKCAMTQKKREPSSLFFTAMSVFLPDVNVIPGMADILQRAIHRTIADSRIEGKF